MTAASKCKMGLRRIPGSLAITLRCFRYTGKLTRATGTPALHALPTRPWAAAATRDFCPNHLSRLSYVVESSTNTRSRAPMEQQFRAPVSVPSPSRDRDIHEQPSPWGLRPGRSERRAKVLESRSKELMPLFRHLHDNAFLVFSRDHKHLYAACLLDLHERFFTGAPAFPTPQQVVHAIYDVMRANP